MAMAVATAGTVCLANTALSRETGRDTCAPAGDFVNVSLFLFVYDPPN